MTEPEAPFTIPRNRVELALFTAASLVFVAVGSGLLTGTVGGPPGPATLVIGVILVALFGLATGTALRLLLDNTPGLVLDQDGVRVGTGTGPAVTVPWTDITGIRSHSRKGQTFIVIETSDPARYPVRHALVQTLFNRLNFVNLETPVWISTAGLAAESESLVRQLERFRAKHG